MTIWNKLVTDNELANKIQHSIPFDKDVEFNLENIYHYHENQILFAQYQENIKMTK